MSRPSAGPIVVVGDALLDVDVTGDVRRVSPDAPVPVLDVVDEHVRPGGAALAALMLAADGHEVVLVTPLGDDEAADQLRAALPRAVTVLAMPHTGETPVKRRLRAGGQSLLRLDSGRHGAVGAPDDRVGEALASASGVLVADYGRGAAAQPELRVLLERVPRRVPVVWDPHPRGSSPVPGVALATPNLAEALQLSGVGSGSPATGDGDGGGLATAAAAAAALSQTWRAGAVSVTLGARGALLSYGVGAPLVVPAPAAHAVDTCGAGDRFAAAAIAALADGAVATEAVQAAVLAAAAYVHAGGAAGLSARRQQAPATSHPGPDAAAEPAADDVVQRVRAVGGTVVATGGCFDLLHAGHVDSLRAARGLGDCLVVCLNSDASVRRLKGAGRPVVGQEDRARVLQALECVDAVLIFDEDTPEKVLRTLRPDVWAKGGDYAGAELPEAPVLAEWGGALVVLPYLRGRSTSDMVRTLAGKERP
jgi:rfaE bifunctional protein nucleotidyltransferase chain/domain/rfaE bifunctional protein kinase chain/domain